MIPLLLLTAFAADGYYHPAEVSAASSAFARAQQVAGTAFEDRSETSQALAAALRNYEEALDLLGDRAPAAERARLEAVEQQYNRDYAVLSAFAQEQLDTLDAAFSEALTRAIGDRDVEVCRPATASTGPRMSPRFGAPSGPESCDGTDLNASLAKTMDADPALAAALDGLLAAEWPTFTVDKAAVPGVGTGELTHAVPVRAWMFRLAPDGLKAIELADEEERLVFQAAIEEGASQAELQEMVGAAKALDAKTAARRAELAAPVLSATEKMVGKWAKKNGAVVGWCAQPALLGGCTVPAPDGAVADEVAATGAVSKAAQRANASRP
jgi:hypothetical protein